MKKRLLFSLLFVTLAFLNCKKSGGSTPTTASSQWAFNGATFKDANTIYSSNSNELFASDNNGNFVRVFFSTVTKPISSGNLTVLDYAATFTNNSQCSMQVGNVNGPQPQPLSTGKSGDAVILTVSSSGKLTASFTNISVQDGSTTKTVSGTLVEQ